MQARYYARPTSVTIMDVSKLLKYIRRNDKQEIRHSSDILTVVTNLEHYSNTTDNMTNACNMLIQNRNL